MIGQNFGLTPGKIGHLHQPNGHDLQYAIWLRGHESYRECTEERKVNADQGLEIFWGEFKAVIWEEKLYSFGGSLEANN